MSKNKKQTDKYFLIYFSIIALLFCITLGYYFTTSSKSKQNSANYNNLTPVDSVTITQSEVNLLVGGKSSLFVTIIPDNANDKTVKWYSSDRSIATVSDEGTVTAISPGKTTIYVSTVNGKTDSCTINVQKEEKVIKAVDKITLEKTRLNINEGETTTLKYEVSPTGVPTHIQWFTSDEEILTVSDVGEIKALKEGTATITVQTLNGKRSTCEVMVSKPKSKEIPVSKLKLNYKSIYLQEKLTMQLESYIEPTNATDKIIRWVSEDPTIATVSNTGLVTGVKAGKTNVSAISSNNIYATCSVEVRTPSEQKQQITDIKVEPDHLILDKGEKTPLKVTIYTTNASKANISWGTSNSSVATVENGLVTAKGAGTAVVSAYSENGIIANCYVTVVEDEKEPTNIMKAEDLFKKVSTTNVEIAQVAVFSKGKVLTDYAYKTQKTTPFKVSSASKTVLGIVAAKMDADGLINLDTNIDKYWHALNTRDLTSCTSDWRSYIGSEKTLKNYTVSSKKLVENPASLRNCLTHSSTIKNMNMVYMVPGDKSSEYFGGGMSKTYARAAFMLAHTSHQLFNQGETPGAKTSYNRKKDNTTRDHALAGFTMQIAMKESINEYMNKNILTPLGCTSSPTFAKGNSIYFATYYQSSAEDLAKLIATVANDGVYNGKQVLPKKAITNIEKVESKLNNQTIAFDYVGEKYTKIGSFASVSNASGYKIDDVVGSYETYITYDPKTSTGFVMTLKYKSKSDKSKVYEMFESISKTFYEKSK